MSSLAGALDDFQNISHHASHRQVVDDVEMPDQPEQSDEDQEDEEMSDLFGNDQDVEESKPETETLALSSNLFSDSSCNFLPFRRVTSPTASGPDSDRLPSPERERRQALEYEEEENPPEIAVEVKEAEVAFPNIPVPKSSDGDVIIIFEEIVFTTHAVAELGHQNAEFCQSRFETISSGYVCRP